MNFNPYKTREDHIRDNGFDIKGILSTGTLTTKNKGKWEYLDWKVYDALIYENETRLMVIDGKITDLAHLESLLNHYNIIINSQDWMLLQLKPKTN